MKRLKMVGLVAMALCIVGATAATGASAHEFLTKVMAKLTAKADGTQVFNTDNGVVECKALQVTAGEGVLKGLIQAATIKYENCKAFGLAATVSPASYLFNADGSVAVHAPITVTALECVLTVPVAGNEKLEKLLFTNVSGGASILLTPEITGITYTGSGTTCPKSGSNGTYTGKSLVGLVGGGLLDWI